MKSSQLKTMSENLSEQHLLEGLSLRYLKVFGIWSVVNDYRTKKKRNLFSSLVLSTTIILSVPYILCQYLAYFIIKVDIQKVTFLNLGSLPGLQCNLRIFMFWYHIDSMSRLYDLTSIHFLSSIPPDKMREAKKKCQKIFRRANFLCTATFLVNISLICTWVGFPGVSVDYILYYTGNMADIKGGKRMVVGGWYPLPMDRTPYFEAVFCYEVVLIVWTATNLAVYAVVFYLPLMCLYAQLSVLGLHAATLKWEKVGSREGSVANSKMRHELYCIIQDHLKLIRYVHELRSIYNPLVTFILGIGIFTLIIAVFQFLFGGLSDLLSTFKFLQVLAYQAVEVIMFCYGSSNIEEALHLRSSEFKAYKSSDLQFAIYSSDWYKADTKFRKSAQMVMIRAVRGETLTAIRMYPVNVETMMSLIVISTIWKCKYVVESSINNTYYCGQVFQFTYTVATLMSRMSDQKSTSNQ